MCAKGGEEMEFRSYRLRVFPNKKQQYLLKRWMKQLRMLQTERTHYYESFPDATASKVENYLRNTFPFLRYLPREAVYDMYKRVPQEKKLPFISEIRLRFHEVNYPYIRVLGLGNLRCARKKLPASLPKNLYIRAKRNGDFTACFTLAISPARNKEVEGASTAIGIDLGIKTLATCSSGEEIQFPKNIEKSRRRYEKLEERLYQFEQNGKAENCCAKKIKRRLTKLRHRMMNQKKDFLRQTSAQLVKNNDLIILETLDFGSILRGRSRRGRHIAKLLPQFTKMILQKARLLQHRVLQVDRWFPSSQLCSRCGYHFGKHPLSEREWTCPHCGHHIQRDYNASVNILREGLRVLNCPI